jgi:hypothetical protein
MSNNRYQVILPWSDNTTQDGFTLQCADLRDTRNGDTFRDGAFRVVVTATGKPAKVGKGGTVPFKGESAWSDGERLLSDLAWAERYTR